MINVKDFRIGNYVMVDGETCRINLVNNDPGFSDTPCIGYEHRGETGYEKCNSDRIMPLPVTEEMLNDFNNDFGKHRNIFLKNTQSDFSLRLDNEFSSIDLSLVPIVKNVKYIHSLQNLFFALVGEEMTVKKTVAAT